MGSFLEASPTFNHSLSQLTEKDSGFARVLEDDPMSIIKTLKKSNLLFLFTVIFEYC